MIRMPTTMVIFISALILIVSLSTCVSFSKTNWQHHPTRKSTVAQETKNVSRCKEVSPDRLDSMLSKYDVFLRKNEEEMIKWDNSFDPTLNFRPRTEQVKNNLIDRTQCVVQQRKNLKRLSQQSLCPWKRNMAVRADKHPSVRSYVKCTCDRCALLASNNSLPFSMYDCVPVFMSKPVLLREEECDADGFQKWTRSVEEISMACVCALKFVMINYGV